MLGGRGEPGPDPFSNRPEAIQCADAAGGNGRCSDGLRYRVGGLKGGGNPSRRVRPGPGRFFATTRRRWRGLDGL